MANTVEKTKKAKIVVTKNGPYLVEGKVPLGKDLMVCDEKGIPIEWQSKTAYPLKESYALCRCGGSDNKPFCDGSHVKNEFDGTETAEHKDYKDQADKYEGATLDLMDAEALCANMQFCHRAGGEWDLIEKTDDPKIKKLATDIACKCGSGRLVAVDKASGNAIEPKLEQSIGLVEDLSKSVSGPLYVKGGIDVVSAEGKPYEVRNRVTLCRCGGSGNKPFCDGTHVDLDFWDGDEDI
jgi:CDGSH-type Zn-finger protein